MIDRDIDNGNNMDIFKGKYMADFIFCVGFAFGLLQEQVQENCVSNR